MAVSFDKVKPNDVLWDCHKYRMGNTTMRRMGSWPVLVVSIDHKAGRAMVMWNGNPATEVDRSYFRKLRRTPMKEST